MEVVPIYDEKSDINIARKVYNESHLTTVHRGSTSAESSEIKRYLHTVYAKLCTSCFFSWNGVSRLLFRLAPIFRWLPKYSVKNDLMADLTGGVTVGIMHIPQGNILKHL